MFDKILSQKDLYKELEFNLSQVHEDGIVKAVVHDDLWNEIPNDLKEKYKSRLVHHNSVPKHTVMFVTIPKDYETPKLVYGELLPPLPSDWYVMKRKNGVYAIKYEPVVGFAMFRKRVTAWGKDIEPKYVPERIKGLLGDTEEEWYGLSFEDAKWIRDFYDEQLKTVLKDNF